MTEIRAVRSPAFSQKDFHLASINVIITAGKQLNQVQRFSWLSSNRKHNTALVIIDFCVFVPNIGWIFASGFGLKRLPIRGEMKGWTLLGLCICEEQPSQWYMLKL